MRIKLSDFSMTVEDRGQGLPVLFIHGYPLNRAMWDPQVDGLSEFIRVLAPDLRGHGDSESTPVDDNKSMGYSMDLMAEDCAALLSKLDISHPVVLCGLSMGGYISFAFYRKYPERVKGLILAATRASAESSEGKAARDEAIQLATSKGSMAIAEASLPKILSPKTYVSQTDLVRRVNEIMKINSIDGIIGDLIGMKTRPDSTTLLPEINVPTLMLHGADDQIIPLEEVEAMHAATPGSKLVIIPDAGHLINLEQPELFNRSIRNYLQGL
jgi:pimeloyl-ACP methyl ester carboxylesterase